jgi:hypothetical protein
VKASAEASFISGLVTRKSKWTELLCVIRKQGYLGSQKLDDFIATIKDEIANRHNI